MNLFKKKKNDLYFEQNLSLGKQVAVFFWEIFKVVVISLVIIIPVRYFLIKPFYVKGDSMIPNFENHEYLVIDEISYRFGSPLRGDTIVLRYPFDSNQYFIKRVIGLPGEKIKISGGNVYIFNEQHLAGEQLIEPYLAPDLKTYGDVEINLASNEYYVLGDNRMASLDSRVFGPLKADFIIGRTLLRGWPVTRFGLVCQEVNYNL